MDVVRMFRKVRNLESAMIYLIGRHNRTSMSLFEPPIIHDVREKRLAAEYYEAVIKGEPAVTVEDIQTGQVFPICNPDESGTKHRRNAHLLDELYGISSEDVMEEKQVRVAADRSNILEVVLSQYP